MVLAGFLLYLSLIIGIGWYSSKFASKGLSEYFLAGRGLNYFVTALSAVASGRSAWLLLGFTGMAYMQGFSAIWAAAGYTVVELFLFLFFAPPFRKFTVDFNCITVPDYFSERFPNKRITLRIMLAVVIILFMSGYVAAQLVAGGKAFSATFAITENYGIFLTALIIFFYTVTGGFLAVSLTDTVQGIFMLFALIGLPIYAIINLGGWQEVMQIVAEGAYFDPWSLTAGAFIGFIGIGLGSPGSPHILVRYMSIDDPKKLKFAAITGTVWNILMAFGALFIGVAGRAYFPELQSLPDADAEKVFPVLAEQLVHPFLFGLIIASVFAAIMSTADSQLLVAASAIVRDLYQKVGRGEYLSETRLVVLSRWAVALLLVFALTLGFVAEDIVFWLVLYSWAGLGATIGPTVLLAVFWRKTTGEGVIAGIITGAALVIAWKQIPFFREMIWDVYELVPAFLGSLFITWLVSFTTYKKIWY
ncbi:MAG: sodium/proline symporter [Candidatus Cyclobacteriaceae bacterium M2_1C_046]